MSLRRAPLPQPSPWLSSVVPCVPSTPSSTHTMSLRMNPSAPTPHTAWIQPLFDWRNTTEYAQRAPTACGETCPAGVSPGTVEGCPGRWAGPTSVPEPGLSRPLGCPADHTLGRT